MYKNIVISLLFAFILWMPTTGAGNKVHIKTNAIEDIIELKDFKKLLRTKTNVLVLFTINVKQTAEHIKIFKEVSAEVRGTGSMVIIDCAEKKKLCKKLKVAPDPVVLKHFKDGEYHKDYDRQISLNSMVNFMRDPTGDLPWEEDPLGKDVLHFPDYLAFMKHLKRNLKPLLIMLYVPWCGFCKRLRPEFSKAATELKPEGYVLGAMDVERKENTLARKVFNLTGFPTLIYFENGQLKQHYEGENNKEAIVAFMHDPASVPLKQNKEFDWSSDTNSEIVHLTRQGFEPALKDEKSVLVMFYAPWCGHCKRLKPEYEKAAVEMKNKKIPGILAALDVTKETSIAEQFKVKGYPTLKYFVNAQYKYDVHMREAEKLVEFMKDPKEPPPPPPPETPWEEEEDTNVLFLSDQTFNSTLKRKKHALVMFYAPWCGHCKNTRPEFNAAANAMREESRIVFAAVDCTRDTNVCSNQGVRGYPTLKYFSYLKVKLDYHGGRKREDFIAFLKNVSESSKSSQKQIHEEL
uniref:Thioredoxin domain-containing protein n=1 Tax=Glossina pallidipes TaxID=7398 RepID=A0A1A9ZP08_GLOPL